MVWIFITLASLLVLLVVARLLLPFIAKAKINSVLRKMDSYTAEIETLRIHLFAGKINVNNITINKRDALTVDGDSLLHIPELIVSFRWKALLKKELELEISVNAPKVFVLDDRTTSPSSDDPKEKAADQSSKLKDHISGVLPFHVNVTIHDAAVRYIKTNPALDVEITGVNITVIDFSNHPDQTNPCLIKIKGLVADGSMHADLKLYPLEPTLTLDLNAELKSINLVLLNALFQTYGKVDINSGRLDLFAEIAIAENSFNGYLQPVLTDLDFIGVQDKNDSLIRKIWERIVAFSVRFLMNRRAGQLATTIPIEGRLDDPQVDVGATIAGLLRNAFSKALRPSLKDIINLGSTRKPTTTTTTETKSKIFSNNEN